MKEINKGKLILPPSLKRGDTIGLAALAGPVVREEEFLHGVRLLTEWGFKVKFNRDLVKPRQGYLAGSDRQRADDLHWLWKDQEVTAIMAVRGGYGSMRLLPLLDLDLLRNIPKILIGFSDISMILAMVLKSTGMPTFHGPNLTTLARSDRESLDSFLHMLTCKQPPDVKPAGLEVLVPGRARGRLCGGNLASLSHQIATPYEYSWQDGIVFLEDINEPAYRIDRFFTHLQQAGRLAAIRGLILGSFENCGGVETIWDVVLGVMQEKNIPIWANFPVGHGNRNLTMPLGVEVEMDSAAGMLRFLEPCTVQN